VPRLMWPQLKSVKPPLHLATQLTHQVYPVWTYSNILLLVPVLLVTDRLRYKPIIVLQAASNLLAFLLLLLVPPGDVACARVAFFVYSLSSVSDVAYFSYIYSLVSPSLYQRVSGYVRGAVLLGYALGAALGQLLVSAFGMALRRLAIVSVVALSGALVVSLFLPMPRRSLLQREAPGGGGCCTACPDAALSLGPRGRLRRVVRSGVVSLRRLAADCAGCYSSVAVVFLSIWFAAGRCGFYQVVSYVQVLWLDKQPHNNFTAYNGVVDALATLSGESPELTPFVQLLISPIDRMHRS